MFIELTHTTSPGDHPAVQDCLSSGSLSRLLTAAVINQGFRNLLLTKPEEALKKGFQGEEFPLSQEDRQRVLAIRARDLADFALQLSTPGKSVSKPSAGCWFLMNQPAVVLNAE